MKKWTVLLIALMMLTVLSSCNLELSATLASEEPETELETEAAVSTAERVTETLDAALTLEGTAGEESLDKDQTETLPKEDEKKEDEKENQQDTVIVPTPDEGREEEKVEEELEAPRESVLYFINTNVDGRWNQNSITVAPKEIYVRDGKLYANCFIVNGYSTVANPVNILEVIIMDRHGTVVAHDTFQEQNLNMAALSYVEHTFIFDAAGLEGTYVDLSDVTLNARFSATH
ncbi:MAG: SLAP domain-containing protein [Clostridia bacterium]|nr:SLAP domain-containing protein [Clostridia bacterium]